jgi:hypothetical protein
MQVNGADKGPRHSGYSLNPEDMQAVVHVSTLDQTAVLISLYG